MTERAPPSRRGRRSSSEYSPLTMSSTADLARDDYEYNFSGRNTAGGTLIQVPALKSSNAPHPRKRQVDSLTYAGPRPQQQQQAAKRRESNPLAQAQQYQKESMSQKRGMMSPLERASQAQRQETHRLGQKSSQVSAFFKPTAERVKDYGSTPYAHDKNHHHHRVGGSKSGGASARHENRAAAAVSDLLGTALKKARSKESEDNTVDLLDDSDSDNDDDDDEVQIKIPADTITAKSPSNESVSSKLSLPMTQSPPPRFRTSSPPQQQDLDSSCLFVPRPLPPSASSKTRVDAKFKELTECCAKDHRGRPNDNDHGQKPGYLKHLEASSNAKAVTATSILATAPKIHPGHPSLLLQDRIPRKVRDMPPVDFGNTPSSSRERGQSHGRPIDVDDDDDDNNDNPVIASNKRLKSSTTVALEDRDSDDNDGDNERPKKKRSYANAPDAKAEDWGTKLLNKGKSVLQNGKTALQNIISPREKQPRPPKERSCSGSEADVEDHGEVCPNHKKKMMMMTKKKKKKQKRKYIADESDVESTTEQEPPMSSLPGDLQVQEQNISVTAKTFVEAAAAAAQVNFFVQQHDREQSPGDSEDFAEDNKRKGFSSKDNSASIRVMSESIEDDFDYGEITNNNTVSNNNNNNNNNNNARRERQVRTTTTTSANWLNSRKGQPKSVSKPLSFSKANNSASERPKRAPAKRVIPGETFGRQQQVKKDDSDSEWTFDGKPMNQRRRSPRMLQKKPASSPEIVAILESDDEEVVEQVHVDPGDVLELTRIAIGSKVASAECRAILHTKTFELELEWKNAQRGRATRSDDRTGRQKCTLCLTDGTLDKFRFYCDPHKNNSTTISTLQVMTSADETEMEAFDPLDQLGPFVALNIKPTKENGLTRFHKCYQPQSEDPKRGFVVLEFRNEDAAMGFAELCKYRSLGTDMKAIPREECKDFALSLLSDSKAERNKMKQSKFIAGRPLDFVLLVYPFAGDPKDIENAAAGLNEARGTGIEQQSLLVPSERSTDDQAKDDAKVKQRAHMVSINVEDYKRLELGEWLNDSLVDFWMQWISRDDTMLDAKFHFFTSHFYTTLASDGVEAVASWTRRKKINIFEKRLIFVPIVKQMHWSLCVIVNPGALVDAGTMEHKQDDPLSCMIFMDSLSMHNKTTVARHIRKWLNSELQRKNKDVVGLDEEVKLFDEQNFRIFSPKVPRQNNGYDCGVFVCRYAYAIYELRDRNFTYGDAGMYCRQGDHAVSPGAASRAFRDLISDGAEFDFDMDDIARFREEFKTLIERLSALYLKSKSAKATAVEEPKNCESVRESMRTFKDQTTDAMAENHDGVFGGNPGAESKESANTDEEGALEGPHLPYLAFAAPEGKENASTETDPMDMDDNAKVRGNSRDLVRDTDQEMVMAYLPTTDENDVMDDDTMEQLPASILI